MIVEITTHEDKCCRIVASEVVAYEDFTLWDDNGDKLPAVLILLRGNDTRVAKHENLVTFQERLQAALGGRYLQVHALPADKRVAPVKAAPIPADFPLPPAAPTPVNTPPNGQIIVDGVRYPPPPQQPPPVDAVASQTNQISDVSGSQAGAPKPTTKKK